jgi:hypothetical protein
VFVVVVGDWDASTTIPIERDPRTTALTTAKPTIDEVKRCGIETSAAQYKPTNEGTSLRQA